MGQDCPVSGWVENKSLQHLHIIMQFLTANGHEDASVIIGAIPEAS